MMPIVLSPRKNLSPKYPMPKTVPAFQQYQCSSPATYTLSYQLIPLCCRRTCHTNMPYKQAVICLFFRFHFAVNGNSKRFPKDPLISGRPSGEIFRGDFGGDSQWRLSCEILEGDSMEIFSEGALGSVSIGYRGDYQRRFLLEIMRGDIRGDP